LRVEGHSVVVWGIGGSVIAADCSSTPLAVIAADGVVQSPFI